MTATAASCGDHQVTWEHVRLGEFVTLKRGYDLPSSRKVDGDFAHSRELLIPDEVTYALFEQHMLVLHDQIDQPKKENNALAHARDLLLPRQMNGEIAV